MSPCIGANDPKDGVEFSPLKFGQHCRGFVSGGHERCQECSEEMSANIEEAIKEDFPENEAEEPMECLEGQTLEVFGEVKTELGEIDDSKLSTVKLETGSSPKQCYEVISEFLPMTDAKTCTLCLEPSKFEDIKLFRKHMFREHKVKMFKCVHCDHNSFTIDGVSKHSKKSHGYGTFVCVECNKNRKKKVAASIWVSEIVSHMQRRHSRLGESFLIHCPLCKEDINVLNNGNSYAFMDTHYKNCVKERIQRDTVGY